MSAQVLCQILHAEVAAGVPGRLDRRARGKRAEGVQTPLPGRLQNGEHPGRFLVRKCIPTCVARSTFAQKISLTVLHKRYPEHVNVATGKLWSESTTRGAESGAYGRRVRNMSAGATAEGKGAVVRNAPSQREICKLSPKASPNSPECNVASRKISAPLTGTRRPCGAAN